MSDATFTHSGRARCAGWVREKGRWVAIWPDARREPGKPLEVGMNRFVHPSEVGETKSIGFRPEGPP